MMVEARRQTTAKMTKEKCDDGDGGPEPNRPQGRDPEANDRKKKKRRKESQKLEEPGGEKERYHERSRGIRRVKLLLHVLQLCHHQNQKVSARRIGRNTLREARGTVPSGSGLDGVPGVVGFVGVVVVLVWVLFVG